MNKYRVSETFLSLQGEGNYTGKNTVWLRWFLCNLNCDGFNQPDPTDRSTYLLPYKEIPLVDITDVSQLPIFERGCDSSYSWSKKYRHLIPEYSAFEIANVLEDILRSEYNPEGKFLSPHSLQETHMAFTGGEPMITQDGIIEVLEEFYRRKNCPRFITIETNGTRKITEDLKVAIDKFHTAYEYGGYVEDERGNPEWFWSVSPKLFNVSGEPTHRAIKPEVVAEYAKVSDAGQLKFVVNGTTQAWAELEDSVKKFRDAGVTWDVYIMAVGANKEQQEQDNIARIAEETLKRGYHFSGRLHCHIWSNAMGK